jgi:hypothetical protein
MFSKTCLSQIYANEKVIKYNIEYIQSKNHLKTEETISLTITGKKRKNDENQLEVIWSYNTKPKTQKKFQDQFSIGWFSTDTTGIIENETKIWLHPPRHNQYTLTEIAPFPDFRKNLIIGDTYNSFLYIGSGFGEWAGKKIKSIYVIKNVTVEQGDAFWTIIANSELDGKTNSCEFILSEKQGFVSLVYNFFNGDKMIMKLKE